MGKEGKNMGWGSRGNREIERKEGEGRDPEQKSKFRERSREGGGKWKMNKGLVSNIKGCGLS